MLRQEIHKWFTKLFAKGARPDIEKELREDGYYENAQNMRPVSVDGTSGGATKIGGEVVDFSPAPSEVGIAPYYTCIGAATVTGVKVTFWAAQNALVDPAGYPVIVKVDGVTMVRSSLIPYRYDRQLQFGEVNRCVGGVLYPADRSSEALFWDIPAIQAAYAQFGINSPYLTNFILESVMVSLAWVPEWVEHEDTLTTAGGLGMAPGRYIYWLRAVTLQGDRTNDGPPSPPIDVPRVKAPVYNAGSIQGHYPGGQNNGDIPSLTPNSTPYAIKLRFLIDNRLDYSFYEVVRQAFNGGLGINGPGVTTVIGRIEVAPQEFDYRDFTDPVDVNFNEVIPIDQVGIEQVNFTAPGTVEHIDNRVVYGDIQRRGRVADLIFRAVNGIKAFPITQKVFTLYSLIQYNDGYADPKNNTYLKGMMHNERYSLGAMFWDGTSTRSPVVPIVDNYTAPSRRARKTGDSLQESSDPIYAANNECQDQSGSGIPYDPVSPTFDAFRQGKLRKITGGPNAFVNVMGPAQGGFQPWSPISPTAQDASRYRVSPMVAVAPDGVNFTSIAGNIFAPEVHALGVGIYGPTNIPTAAPWAKVMSIMSSPAAGRVVAEGVWTYKLLDATTVTSNNLKKSPSEGVAFFPDIDSSLVPDEIIQDIASNLQNYRIRLTPVGFYTEVYGYAKDPTAGVVANGIGCDLLTYAGVQFDNGAGPLAEWQVNVGEQPGTMGAQPGASAPAAPTNYVAPGIWRRLNSDPLSGNPAATNYSPFLDPANTDQGAHLFGIESFGAVAEGRGRNYNIRLSENPYTLDGQVSLQHFTNTTTRRFHEPFYIMHILRVDALVPTLNVSQYYNTGTNIVVAPEGRCIGIGTGGAREFELFHARKADAVGKLATDYRYAYIQAAGVDEQRYVCVTNNAFVTANFATISADILANGFWIAPDGLPVHGVYEYLDEFNTTGMFPQTAHPVGYLGFGTYPGLPVPAAGARVSVKYNPDSVIRAFGFDCTTAPAVFAPVDRTYRVGSTAQQNTHLVNSAPLPYATWRKQNDYVMPYSGIQPQQNPSAIAITQTIRQWVVMYDAVTRTPQRYNTAADDGTYAFPKTHYIPHTYQPGADSNLPAQYDQSFPGAGAIMNMGGFYFKNEYNLDYAKQPLITGLGVPRNSPPENNDLCTVLIASNRRDPLATDSPGQRTFLEENLFGISEENGRIKKIIALDQGSFQQLWVWAADGLCAIPYNKNILVGADANIIGTQSYEQFWPREEIWKVRGGKGMPDELWRLSTKANAPAGSGDIDTAFWFDRTSWYQLVNGQVIDIAREKFSSVIQPLIASTPGDHRPGYSAMYNAKQGEVWASFPNGDGTSTVQVFSAVKRDYVGYFTYNYDQFLCDDTRLYGFRGLGGNKLDTGLVMITPTGTEPVEGWAETTLTPYPMLRSELVSWRVAPDKPDEIQVFDISHNLMMTTNEAINGPLYTKYVDSWQQLMGRCDPGYVQPFGIPRMRVQDTSYYVRVTHRTAAPFTLTFASVQAKMIQ